MTHIETKASHFMGMPEKQAARSKDWHREYCTMIIQKKQCTKHQWTCSSHAEGSRDSRLVWALEEAATWYDWAGLW